MSVSVLYILALVANYLSPVDFVHLIKVCRYIHDQNVSNIPMKRKESLSKYITCKYDELERGYKLPNGKLEGRYEKFTYNTYKVLNYVNGNIEGTISYYIHDYVLTKRKLANRLGVIRKIFKAWEEMDLSVMILDSIVYPDGSLVWIPGRPTHKNQVDIPVTGQFFFDVYSESLSIADHKFLYRYVDGIVKDIWINEACGQEAFKGKDMYIHIGFTDEGKNITCCFDSDIDTGIYATYGWTNFVGSIFISRSSPDYNSYDEYDKYIEYSS